MISRELLRVLDAYERCDSDAMSDLTFELIDHCVGHDPADPEMPVEAARAVREFYCGIYHYCRSGEAADRLTIPDAAVQGEKRLLALFEALPDSYKESLRQKFEKIDSEPGTRRNDPPPPAEMLEQQLLREAIGKVPKMVERAGRFDKVAVSPSTPRPICDLFAEAHRCFIYGFPVASAVLCRSLVEAALKERIDPGGAARFRDKAGGLTRSYVLALACEANARGAIDSERTESIRQIVSAGNAATHDPVAFKRRWHTRVGDILDSTRKVIEDLYPTNGAEVGRPGT